MEINEEWNNFMHRVTEITQIVSDLATGDKETSQKAQTLADKYLAEDGAQLNEGLETKIKSERTLINKIPGYKEKKFENPNEMDPETFMKQVSRDADQRAADKIVRRERADTFKTRASKAFRRGDYDTALICYNKAIEQIKDSCLLYTNRALTLIKLKQYEKVFHDCEWALRCNESSFKAQLYQVKAHQGMENTKKFQEEYAELIEKFPEHKETIDDFLKSDSENENSD